MLSAGMPRELTGTHAVILTDSMSLLQKLEREKKVEWKANTALISGSCLGRSE